MIQVTVKALWASCYLISIVIAVICSNNNCFAWQECEWDNHLNGNGGPACDAFGYLISTTDGVNKVFGIKIKTPGYYMVYSQVGINGPSRIRLFLLMNLIKIFVCLKTVDQLYM